MKSLDPSSRRRRSGLGSLYALLLCVLLSGVAPLRAQLPLYGDIGIHDPSTLIKDGDRYYTFGTGDGIRILSSTNLRDWTGGRIFGAPPAWTTTAVPGFTGYFWAPDVAYFNGKYHVYYSISTWGTIDSAIGLVTTPSLQNPVWTDHGKIVQSDWSGGTGPDTDYTEYNCIDPSVLVDTDGSVWLIFGSYSNGIVVVQIDPATGKRLNNITTRIANNGPVFFSSTAEAAYVYKHGGYYYLFLNFGGCCSGLNSTYNIRVGRSTDIRGPYIDKAGVNMENGGGTMLFESTGRFIGPGHAGLLNDNGTYWFSHHYYDGNGNGWSPLGIRELKWGGDGWPVLAGDWSAFYPFDVDAREHAGQYNGTIAGGAAVVAEAGRGKVLSLNGNSQYVALPLSVANARTVSAWVKWDGGVPWQRIFDFGASTSACMYLTPSAASGKLRFAIANGGGEQVIEAPSALPVNTWCHVAVTLDGSVGVLYLNGVPVASAIITIRPWELLARNLYIGKSQYSVDPYFSGRIDSLRIFARALSAAEVASSASITPALAHRYSFAADARDSVGMANGTLMGSAAIVNGAVNLNGSAGTYVNLPNVLTGNLVSGASALTMESWVTFRNNGPWARLFDFGNIWGNLGADFLFFTPRTSGNTTQLAMGTGAGSPLVQAAGNLDNKTGHLVCIVDPANGYMATYFNGVKQAEFTGPVPSLKNVVPSYSFLGRSLFSADSWLNASIDELRVYDGRLLPQEIAGNYVAGPNMVVRDALTWAGTATQGWDLATSNWKTTNEAAAPWTDRSSALFLSGGTAINLTADVQASSLIFNASGFSLSSTTGKAISLGPILPNVNTGADAVIGVPLVGSGGLGKTGHARLSLTAANTYTGDTTIDSGTLSLLNNGAVYSSGWNATSVLTINSGGTLELDRWGYGPVGTYRTQALGGLDYGPERIVINGGTIRFTGGAAGAPQDPGEAPYGPGFTVGANGATLEAAKAGDTWTVKNDSRGGGVIVSTAGGTVTLSGSGNGIFDKVLPGSGGLVKSGTGRWTLSQPSTYSGNTTINAGVLSIVNGGAIYSSHWNPTAVVTVNTGGTLELDRWGYGPVGTYRTQALGGLSYPPELLVINGGTIRYTGGAAGAPQDPVEAPYGPGFTIGANGATFEAAKAGDTWTVKGDSRGVGVIVSTEGGTLTLTGIGNGVLDKVLPGTGALVKSGTGTWTLNRANTYSGYTQILQGKLALNFPSIADASALRIASGAKVALNYSGSDTIASLELGGVVVRSGTYSAAHAQYGGYFEGTGSLTVPGAYDKWASRYPGLSDRAFDADPDRDGVPNGIEAVMGGDPTNSDGVSVLPVIADDAADGLTLVFRRDATTANDISLVVEWGAALTTPFSRSIPVGTSDLTTPEGVSVDIDAPSAGFVTVHIPASETPTGKLFARLRATRNP